MGAAHTTSKASSNGWALVERLEEFRLTRGYTYERIAILVGSISNATLPMALRRKRPFSARIARKVERYLHRVGA